MAKEKTIFKNKENYLQNSSRKKLKKTDLLFQLKIKWGNTMSL